MSLPTAAFLDTSIFAGQQYNFESAALTSFVPVAISKQLTLLLPDATKREITRQISDRSVEALRALEAARRRAPLLSKWKGFPALPESRYGDWEVKRVALQEWAAFIGRFSVKELGYEGVRIETVMGWYDSIAAPFREGKKRKEFPDAFALAAVASFADKNSVYVAVVSEDQDFKAACDRFPRLLYFASLPALTELLLADEATIENARAVALAGQDTLEQAIYEEAGNLGFYHADDKYDDVDSIDFDELSLHELRVVALGGLDCTVTFSATLHLSARVSWREMDYYEDYDRRDSARVHDATEISGTAKLRFSAERKVVESVTLVELDQADAELTAEP